MSRALIIAAVTVTLAAAPAQAGRLHPDDAHPPAPATPPSHVTVQPGGTLAELAAGWPGGWTRAAHVNDLDDPDLIVAGDQLRIPAKDGKRWVPPRPTPAASRSVATSAPSPKQPAGSVGTSVWHRLAQCESGGNWSANTGNGYYGGLQFLPSTWRSVGGTGLPHQHSAAEQIKRGQILQARAGWGQWPACSAKLGLR